jgi:hypothetical protein
MDGQLKPGHDEEGRLLLEYLAGSLQYSRSYREDSKAPEARYFLESL